MPSQNWSSGNTAKQKAPQESRDSIIKEFKYSISNTYYFVAAHVLINLMLPPAE